MLFQGSSRFRSKINDYHLWFWYLFALRFCCLSAPGGVPPSCCVCLSAILPFASDFLREGTHWPGELLALDLFPTDFPGVVGGGVVIRPFPGVVQCGLRGYIHQQLTSSGTLIHTHTYIQVHTPANQHTSTCTRIHTHIHIYT